MFKIIKNKSTEITENLSNGQYDILILASYFGIYKLPASGLHSPLHKDNHPSFGFQLYDNRVMFKDFATKEAGTIIQLLQKMWLCDTNTALQRIEKELNLNSIDKISLKTSSDSVKYKHKSCKISITAKSWDEQSIDYWKQYGISKEQCIFANVFPISYYKCNGYRIKASQLAFAYAEKDNNNQIRYKIYQPYNSRYKWVNGFTYDIISLKNKIPKTGEHLIICSSLKDALCVWCNTKIPCISFQSESQNIDIEIINELKSRYKHIYILYDNDEVGLREAKKHAKECDITNIIIPEFPAGKDISDYYKYDNSLCKELIFKNIITEHDSR